MTSTPERKGLRFEVTSVLLWPEPEEFEWHWTLIGADGPVCRSVYPFETEAEARSNIAASKGRMKAARFAKVVTVDGD